MSKRAFRMKLRPGFEAAYRQRHDAIWPELKALLKDSGISDYRIFLDPSSLYLFGVMEVESEDLLRQLPNHPVMKKWWAYMKDIMDTNPDHSPVSQPLEEVFYLS